MNNLLMSMSVLLSHKIKFVNIFQCLETMGLETMSCPNVGIYMFWIWGKRKCGVLVFFFIPEAEPCSDYCSFLRRKPICNPRSLCLSCKPVVQPDVMSSLILIFKGSISKSMWEAVCTQPLVYRYHRTLPLESIFLFKRK